MQPQITDKRVWIEIDGNEGITIIDAADAPELFEMLEREEMQEGIEEVAMEHCGLRRVFSVTTIEGYGARMSAPGYMDCTDWGVFDTIEDAQAYLDENFSDEDEAEKKNTVCPQCGREIWDVAVASKLNKCWNCGLAFDSDEGEDEDSEDEPQTDASVTYEVIVGNVGVIHTGIDKAMAEKEYDEAVSASKCAFGRASGEPVTLIADGEINREHVVSGEDKDEPISEETRIPKGWTRVGGGE